MAEITVVELELAINFWRDREPPAAGRLGATVSSLAACYGQLIASGVQTLDLADVDPATRGAIDQALQA